jgi:threonine dehydrogenase-like Zn-dependent dehydrogenase
MALFTLLQKRLLGSLYGEANPRADIPRLLSLYREGKLLLDETVTAEYKLNDVNDAYDAYARRPQHPRCDRPRPLTLLALLTFPRACVSVGDTPA